MKSARISNQFLRTLPIFTAFSLTAFLIAAFDLHNSAIALLLGVVAGGLVDMDHRMSGRIKNLLGVLIAFAASALSVQLALHNNFFLLLLLTTLAFFMTLLGAVDVRYRTISFCSLLVALYTLLTYDQTLAWYINPVMIILGTLICQFTILFFYLFFPNHPVQESLADTFKALADYFQCKAHFFAPDEYDKLNETEYELALRTSDVTSAFNATRDILFNRLAGRQLPARRRQQLGDFFIAQDLHERVSATHVDYQDLLQRFTHSDMLFRIERLMNLQGRVCRKYALALENERPFQTAGWLNRADVGVKTAWQYHAQSHGDDTEISRLIDNLGRITAQLNTLGTPHNLSLEDASLQNANTQHWREAVVRLRNNFNRRSVYYRHAVRMAVISFISIVMAQALHLELGYWILLTAILVCQPNRAATKARLIQRIAGTVIGVIVGSLLPYIAPDRITMLTLLVASSTAFFYFRLHNFSFSTFFVTVQVFLSFAFIGMDTGNVITIRVIDTVLGAVIAWLSVYYIYPDQYYQSPRRLTRHALINNANYLGLIIEQLKNGYKDDIIYRSTRRRVHESASALAAMANELDNPAAVKLVQLNYRIVSQLSALASQRNENNKLHNLDSFCQTATTLQTLMNQTLKKVENQNTQMLHKQITEHIKDSREENLPNRALAKIQELLREIVPACEKVEPS